MHIASYLAGLATPFGLGLGVWAGRWWWARLRRAQAEQADMVITGAEVRELPTPPSPPQAVIMGRIRYTANVPGRRRVLRGHKPE